MGKNKRAFAFEFAFVLVLVLAAALSASMLTGCADFGKASREASFDPKKGITVVSREEGSGTRGAFVELMGIQTEGANGTKTDNTTQEAIIANKTGVVLTTVAGDPYAIGYISMGSLNETVKAVTIDEVEATTENVKKGTYPISRPFIIATKGKPTGLARDFIDFILSAEGQAVVAESYIPVNDSAPPYTDSKPAGKIAVAGSSSVTPVMEKLKEAYEAVNPDAKIEIQMSDSTSGMTGAMEGTCDIGMASRQLKDSEIAQLTGIRIALDGIAVVVNPENPAANLSSEQVRAIFTGKAAAWSDVGLGAADGEIK